MTEHARVWRPGRSGVHKRTPWASTQTAPTVSKSRSASPASPASGLAWGGSPGQVQDCACTSDPRRLLLGLAVLSSRRSYPSCLGACKGVSNSLTNRHRAHKPIQSKHHGTELAGGCNPVVSLTSRRSGACSRPALDWTVASSIMPWKRAQAFLAQPVTCICTQEHQQWLFE